MSGMGSTAAAADLLPESLSGAPLALVLLLLVRVRVVRSRDISVFLFAAPGLKGAPSSSVRGRALAVN
jgi:hypothetical protein